MQNLINGYDSIQKFFQDSVYLIKTAEFLEFTILEDDMNDSMHYLRILSILRIRILNDPKNCQMIENKILEINLKDKFLDENTVNSLNILKGNTVSLVSGFKTK